MTLSKGSRWAGLACVCCLWAPLTVTAQTILYVDVAAPGPQQDGQTWCTAFTELQPALDVAQPNTVIRVAEGVYRPDRTGLADYRTAAFSLIDGVTLEGGYAGCGAPDPNERDIAAHKTILSGDLLNDDTSLSYLDDFVRCYSGGSASIAPGCSAYDFNFNGTVDGLDLLTLISVTNYDDNSYHVITSSGNAASAKIDGFTISGGYANGSGSAQSNGGGMYVVVGSPIVTHCAFEYNVATYGGALYNDLNSLTLVTDSTFASNLAFSGSSSGAGGAVVNFNGQPAFRRCVFTGNGAASGGAVFGQNSTAAFESATFVGNHAANGGAMYSSSSNTRMRDALFTGNAANVQGGAMRFLGGSPLIVNATVTQNDALVGGGLSTTSATLTIHNSVLWGNSDGGSGGEATQIDITTGSVVPSNTCIQGLNQYSGSGNIGDDPMFVDPLGVDGLPGTIDDDLRLTQGSPCVDAGNNSVVTTSVDLDGHSRILDGDGDAVAIVDMGAYELTYAPPPSCFAARDLSVPQLNYEPGVTKTIRLELLPDGQTTAIGVEDVPPSGWTDISNISNGGTYDAVAHKVKWGPFFTPFPSELTYDLTPPVTADGTVCFSGATSVNGAQNDGVCGDECIEAQPCPVLPADDAQPACPGCADCSCDVCQDDHVVLCEMVGYACAWKSGCNDDIAAMTRAAYLWQSGEVYCWDGSQDAWLAQAGSATNPACCDPAAPFAAPAIAGGAAPPQSGWAALRFTSTRPVRRGNALQGNVVIRAPTGTVADGLEIVVPDGWRVTTISDGGTWDSVNRKVKWGPFFESLSRTVSFGLEGTSGKLWAGGFSGTVSFDGYNEPVIIRPARFR